MTKLHIPRLVFSSKRNIYILYILYVALRPTFGLAMEFALIEEPAFEFHEHSFPKRLSVIAAGPIVEGDAARLAGALQAAGKDQFGNVSLYLESPGGSVSEAMKMKDIMDLIPTTAHVLPNSLCASACASILYISARLHFVHPGGALGFHPCKVGETVVELCSEIISENAVQHGTPFASVNAFMSLEALRALKEDGRDIDNNDMTILDSKQAMGLGLIGPPTADPSLAVPSFDCDNSEDRVEQAICDNPQLARLENSFSTIRTLFLKLPEGDSYKKLVSKKEKHLKDALEKCVSNFCLQLQLLAHRNHFRSLYVKAKLYGYRDKPVSSEFLFKYHISILTYCQKESSECYWTENAEGSGEFLMENMVYSKILDLAGKPNDSTLDCKLKELCLAGVKTYDTNDYAVLKNSDTSGVLLDKNYQESRPLFQKTLKNFMELWDRFEEAQ